MERACTVPSSKYIFFPILTYINDYPCPDPTFQPAPHQSLEDFLAEGARLFIDATAELELTVDGVAVPGAHPFDYRAHSDKFSFTGDLSLRDAFDGCITGRQQPAVADGYWIMLSPMSPGTHTIHLRGKQVIPSGDPNQPPFVFELNTSYTLTIQ